MTDSSSQSDDYGNCRGRRKATYLTLTSNARRKKGTLNAKERNLRRLESNERERMRMHSLNDAFQVSIDFFGLFFGYNYCFKGFQPDFVYILDFIRIVLKIKCLETLQNLSLVLKPCEC